MSIGHIIKALRTELDMSAEKLCEDICTPRYMYMIENDSRMPSAFIINAFNERLGVSIYDYLEYEAFEKPYSAKVFVDESRMLRYYKDFEKIEAMTAAIENSEDAQKPPVSYEILCNKILVELFAKDHFDWVIQAVNAGFAQLENQSLEAMIEKNQLVTNFNTAYLLNFYYVALIKSGDVSGAYRVLGYLKQSVGQLKAQKIFEPLYISISINYLQYEICERRDPNCLDQLLELLNYQFEQNNLNRAFLTYYLLSEHFHNMGDIPEAKRYFELCYASGLSVGLVPQLKELVKDLDSAYLDQVCPNRSVCLPLF